MKKIFDYFLGGVTLIIMIIIFIKSIVICWPWYIALFAISIVAFLEDLFTAEDDDDDHYGF